VLPWLFFLPFAIKKLRSSLTPQRRFLIVWFALIFIFFSLSGSKRNLYILPLYPAVALFLAEYFQQLISNQRLQKAFQGAFIFSLTLFSIISLGVFPYMDRHKSARPLCEEVKPLLSQGAQLGSYKFFKEAYLYYIGGEPKIKILETQEALLSYFKEDPKNIVLVRKRDLAELEKKFPIQVVADRKVGHRHIFVIGWKG